MFLHRHVCARAHTHTHTKKTHKTDRHQLTQSDRHNSRQHVMTALAYLSRASCKMRAHSRAALGPAKARMKVPSFSWHS